MMDVLTNILNGTYIQFGVESEMIVQTQNVFLSPLELIRSYYTFNGSYFQPPPVISRDFQSQFNRFFTYVNNDIKRDNNTILIDFGYTDDIDYYEIYLSTNHTNVLDTRSYQEITMIYNKETGILESYHNLISFKDDTQGLKTEGTYISNTSQTPETSSGISTTPLVIFLVLVIIFAVGFYSFKLLGRKKNIETPIPELSPSNIDPSPLITDHYETLLSGRSKVEIKPKIVKRILCPTCNTINMLDSKYCIECGTYISE